MRGRKVDVLLDLSDLLLVPLIPKVVLVVDDEAEALGVSRLCDEGPHGVDKLRVTVGCNSDEYLPVLGNGVRLLRL